MEIIVTSKHLGAFADDSGDYDLYAEVCRTENIGWTDWVARIVECPEGYPDRLLKRVGGMHSEGEAADKLANMVVAFRRATQLF